jgi:hypothetical protein
VPRRHLQRGAWRDVERDVRRVRPGRAMTGRDWMGLAQRGDYDVVGVETTPLLPGVLVLLLGIGGLMAAWRREGRA